MEKNTSMGLNLRLSCLAFAFHNFSICSKALNGPQFPRNTKVWHNILGRPYNLPHNLHIIRTYLAQCASNNAILNFMAV